MAQLLNRRNTLLAAAASRVIGATVVISTGASTALTIQNNATTTLPGTLVLTALTARFVAPSYAWYTKLAGSGSYTLISGATTDTLTVTGDSQFITNVAGSTAIQYKVVVTETGGYTNTASYEVTIPILREGTNAITGALTNDTLTVPAATDGTVSAGVYSSLTSDFQIYNGSADDSANWTVSFTNSAGISATLSNGKTISITNITTAFESGYIELTATRQGYTSIVKRISVAKVKSGTIGVSPTIYDIVVPSPVIAKDAYGAYTSSTLSISSFSTTGSTTSAFSGIYKIYHNGSGTASYTSAAAESTKSYTLVAGLTSVKIELYNAAGTTLLDTQTIPVVESGSNAIYISIENGTYAIPSDASGNVSTYASSGAKITVREGTTALTYRTTLGSNVSSFTVGTPTLSTANGIVVGSFSGNGTTTATVAAHSGMQAALQTITITYPVTYNRANGGQATEYITQSITKAYGGIRGSLNIYSTDAAYTSTYDYDGAGAIVAGAASYAAKATDLVYSATPNSSPRTPIEGDTVTFTNGSTYVYTITYKASSSTWVAPGTVIDGNLLVTGSVTANKVDTRGLTIKDASGNIILQAGSSIDWSKLGGASSNLSGLGYTGDLNATVGAPTGTTVGGTLAETVASKSNGALQRAGDAITGRISMNVADGIFAGTDTNNGVYMGNGGLVGKKAGVTTFAVDTAGNATFGGALNAATGTFAGSLSAATGTFAGSLSAATGTFSGTLTAAAVNAVDTINLAGNSVTIPIGVQWTGSITTASYYYTQILSTPSTNFSSGQVLVIAEISGDMEVSEGYLASAPSMGLYRGSTFLTNVTGWISYLGGGGAGGLIVFIDSPGGGAVSYSVKVTSASATNFTARSAVITVVGLKR